jgi:hypothetical protein
MATKFLRRVRDAVIEHPVTETRRRPDFLATSHGAESLVMEMTSIGASDADKARAGRLKTIYDQINSWEIPNFMLHLTVLTEGPGNPPLRRLRRELRDWIDGLDVDEIAALSAVSDSFFTDQSAPRYTWTQANERYPGWGAVRAARLSHFAMNGGVIAGSRSPAETCVRLRAHEWARRDA